MISSRLWATSSCFSSRIQSIYASARAITTLSAPSNNHQLPPDHHRTRINNVRHRHAFGSKDPAEESHVLRFIVKTDPSNEIRPTRNHTRFRFKVDITCMLARPHSL